jgi:uncharacterized repeat protein (TIGR01451 family)
MADQSANKTPEITFIFNPEPRYAQVDLSQGTYVEIVIVAQNRSGRPVRVQPILDPMWNQSAYGSEPLPTNIWAAWMSLQDTSPELDFEANGVHSFIVRINLPLDAQLGQYQFRLILSGVQNPDDEFAASDPITFTVTGPPRDLRPLAIGASALLVVVILGIIAFFLLVRPRPSLEITLKPPPYAIQGEPATYTLSITNQGSKPAANVMVDYTLPDGVVGAAAYVPGETLRHCDALDLERRVRCDLDTLEVENTAQVDFLVIPGPASETITNTLAFTVSAQLDQALSVFPVEPPASKKNTAVNPASSPFAIALLPSTITPLSGEKFDFQVLAWSTVTTTQTLTFTLTLPPGIHFIENLDREKYSLTQPDYFTMSGKLPLPFAGSVADITHLKLPAQADLPVTAPARLEAISNLSPDQALTRTAAIDVVETALYFDGRDDWVQLGYNQAPKEFTIEMWVHPYSGDDGQSFAGLHRQEPDGVSNLFLVGYWFGGLHINVNGISHNLDFPKDTSRYHLAVVVKQYDQGKSTVTVYKNGVEQAWSEPEPEGICDRCKIFDSTMPGGENSLLWVLGQEWDLGSQGKKASDFFHGTLGEVRIWDTARTKEEINATYQVRPRGDEPHLVAYYRLEPVDPDSEMLPSRAASASPGQRMGGVTWVEAEPRYGTALQFNGLNQSLAAPGLELASFKATPTGEVELTLAARIMVAEIPSQQEWILGSTVPSGSTILEESTASPQAGVIPPQQALVSAENEVLSALQAAQEINLDITGVISASRSAREALFASLVPLSGSALDASSPARAELLDITPLDKEPGALIRIPSLDQLAQDSNNEIASLAKEAKENQTRHVNLLDEYMDLKGKYDQLQKDPPSPSTSTINATLAELQTLKVLIINEKLQFYTNLESLSLALKETARISGQKQWATASAILKDFPPYEVLRSLTLLAHAEDNLTQEELSGEERVTAFDSLQDTQEKLSLEAVQLETWLGDELQKTLQKGSAGTEAENTSRQAYIASLATAQYHLQAYRAAQLNLEAVLESQARISAAQEHLAAAQEQISAAQAKAEAVAEVARQAKAEAAHLQQLEANFLKAQQDLQSASTEEAKKAAQSRLKAAGSELENARLDQYRGLSNTLEALQDPKAELADLELRLDTAVKQATEAAFSAARRCSVERWIGPYLDLYLGKQTPYQSAQEAIRPAALLAAQEVLKNAADFKIDQAEADLNAALEKARLAALGDAAVQRQAIIDQVVEYLGQYDYKSTDLGDSEIPPLLAEALAQAIADQVTAETIRRLPALGSRQLLFSTAELEALAQEAVKASVTNALETSRLPLRIRLYYQTAYAVLRLDKDLAANELSGSERNLKTCLRSRLAAANAALLRLLNAQNVPLVPASGLDNLVAQVVDESRSADEIARLSQELQVSLDSAYDSLHEFLGYAEKQNRTYGLDLPAGIDACASGQDQPGAPPTIPITVTLNLPTPNLVAGLMVDADGHVMLVANAPGSSDWTWVKDEKPLQPGQWVDYAIVIRYNLLTRTITEAVLYRDGNDVKGDITGRPGFEALAALRCEHGFYLGGLCGAAGELFFAGRIDEVRLWNRALTETEIDTWRKLPGAIFDEWAYWAFNDGPGQDMDKDCLSSQTCDLSKQGGFHLTVEGPGWVASDILLYPEAR